MGDPLEKVYNFFGFKVRVKQVLDVSVLKKIDQNSLYFVPWPASVSSFEDELSRIAEELPLSIRVTISDWYFISIEEGISLWQDFLLSLKRSHAKKIRRYCKKPHKFHYTAAWLEHCWVGWYTDGVLSLSLFYVALVSCRIMTSHGAPYFILLGRGDARKDAKSCAQ